MSIVIILHALPSSTMDCFESAQYVRHNRNRREIYLVLNEPDKKMVEPFKRFQYQPCSINS